MGANGRYLPWMKVGTPTLDGGGVPTLDRWEGYLPWTGGGIPTLDRGRGTYLGWGRDTYFGRGGVPTLKGEG